MLGYDEWTKRILTDPWIRQRKTFVPPSGPSNSKIALVGEQPGRREVAKRKPFVGPAGDEVTADLQTAGIPRAEVYFTNVIKDLDHDIKYYIDIPPKKTQSIIISEEGRKYISILKDELLSVKPNIVIAHGAVALWVLGERRGIYAWRGSVFESTLIPGMKVIPTLHAATVIPPKNVYLNKHLIVMDFTKAREQSAFPEYRPFKRNLIIRPSFDTCEQYLKMIYSAGLEGVVVDYDIELSNMEVSCISFSIRPDEAICIPFICEGGDYFTAGQEAHLMRMVASIMEDERITKRGQNVIFDNHFLLRKYGIVVRSYDGVHDTMIAQNTLYPDFEKGLDFIASMWTDIPYYKIDGKFWLKGIGSWEKGWQYNALDSIVCDDAHPKQYADLRKMDNVAAYNRQRKLIPPLTYMMERGIKVDLKGMKASSERAIKDSLILQEKLNSISGRDLNAQSSKQLIQYFYIDKGHPPYKGRDGKVTTDEEAMKRLSRKGFKEADLVLQIRGLNKRASTYLEVEKVDPDGRIRCSYNPVGTRYSRLSSSKNIFGTGTNLQNWPHDILEYLVADEGYVAYNMDLSQFENRIVAYVGNITQMIEAFEQGKDVHRLTAALIFGIAPDEVSDEPGSASIGGGKFSQRFWGKKANHAFNYDFGYRSFSLTYEIPENDGKWIYSRYHTAYPGVKQSYHVMVRAQLAKNRTLTNLLGRRTLFLGKWEDKTFKEAYSCIPQGTCGDVINERGVNYIYYDQNSFWPVELLLQVHDSIGFQIPLSVPWSEHAEMIIKIKRSLETPLVAGAREFVIPVDLTVGKNFCKEKGVELKGKNFPEDVKLLSERLKEIWSKLNGEKTC